MERLREYNGLTVNHDELELGLCTIPLAKTFIYQIPSLIWTITVEKFDS